MDFSHEPEELHYERACKLIGAELARYEYLIQTELTKESPDSTLIEEYRQIEEHLAAQRESLNHQDNRTIEDVLNRYQEPVLPPSH